MRVVAAGAEIVNPLTRTSEISHPFSMNASPPVLVLVAMAFAAEPIAFCKVDQVPVIEPQLISILRVMAVEAPSHRFGVMEFDIGVLFLEFPFLTIHLHRGMAVTAGEQALGHRRRSILLSHCRRRGSEKKQQKRQGNRCSEYSHDRSVAFLPAQKVRSAPLDCQQP